MVPKGFAGLPCHRNRLGMHLIFLTSWFSNFFLSPQSSSTLLGFAMEGCSGTATSSYKGFLCLVKLFLFVELKFKTPKTWVYFNPGFIPKLNFARPKTPKMFSGPKSHPSKVHSLNLNKNIHKFETLHER